MIARLTVALLLGVVWMPLCRAEDGSPRPAGTPVTLAPGTTFTLAGRPVAIETADVLPLVENEYSRRFVYDRFGNPKLKELRTRHALDAVVADGKDEFDRQVLLLDWTFRQFRKFGTPTSQANGALDILQAISEGHTFFCAHYASVFASAAASLGWVDRLLALKRVDNAPGATEHTITEIWSNQYRKWVMLDPTFALYVEKDGVPLNAYQIRQEWLYNKGEGLLFVIGAKRERFTGKDLPVVRGRFAGFGDLSLDALTLNMYAYLGYVPNTNLMDAGKDWGGMFITKDKLCEGVPWHTRKNPQDPEHEPYFPLNQASLTLTPAQGMGLQVALRTLTPNFRTFQVRRDGGEWVDSPDALTWTLHDGANRLEAKSVNRFGVEGPVSRVELTVPNREP